MYKVCQPKILCTSKWLTWRSLKQNTIECIFVALLGEQYVVFTITVDKNVPIISATEKKKH